MRPVCICSVPTTQGSFKPADYKEVQHTISLFMPKELRGHLSFCEGACWQLTFDETPLPMPKVDSEDEEYLLTADLVWSKEPVPDSREYLCIHGNTLTSNPTHKTKSSGHTSNPTP